MNQRETRRRPCLLPLWNNEIGCKSARYQRGINAAVKGSETAFPMDGEGKEIKIRQMFRDGQVGQGWIEQRNRVRPELMPRHGAHLPEQGTNDNWWTRRLRIRWLAENPEKGVLSERAGGPGPRGPLVKPRLCTVVMDVKGIRKGDQDIDIQKVHGEGNSY